MFITPDFARNSAATECKTIISFHYLDWGGGTIDIRKSTTGCDLG